MHFFFQIKYNGIAHFPFDSISLILKNHSSSCTSWREIWAVLLHSKRYVLNKISLHELRMLGFVGFHKYDLCAQIGVHKCDFIVLVWKINRSNLGQLISLIKMCNLTLIHWFAIVSYFCQKSYLRSQMHFCLSRLVKIFKSIFACGIGQKRKLYFRLSKLDTFFCLYFT